MNENNTTTNRGPQGGGRSGDRQTVVEHHDHPEPTACCEAWEAQRWLTSRPSIWRGLTIMPAEFRRSSPNSDPEANPDGSTAIKLILDNHSVHISKETKAWLATCPPGRFEFTFTPKHGSWLNLIEGFFSKFARSVLRHIRVTSKQELKERIMAGIKHVNRRPVVHTWSYRLTQAI